MKRIIHITIIALLALTGCKKAETELSLQQKLETEWRGSEISADAAIYISFAADGTFELYQKLESDTFELRRGKWTLDGDILSGRYNDGETWASSYKVAVENDKLVMISQNEGGESGTYKRCQIPDVIKENCTIVVKSGN